MLNIKTVRQFEQFTDSIRFSENNISFINDISDDTYKSYHNALSRTLEHINIYAQKREADMNFYDNLLNRIDFALIVANTSGSIIWINKFALDLLGRPKPFTIKDIKDSPPHLREAIEDLQPKSSRIFKLEQGGKVRSLIINLSRITVKGNVLNVYSLKDVQPVVEDTENIAWQQLISVLTHEIMNSLTPIISLSETLSGNDNSPEMTNKAIQTIHRRSKGLINFVNNYKKLAQIPSPQRSKIEVKALIEDVVGLMKKENIQPHILIAPDDLILYADREQMEQVMINLLKNAYEACTNVATPQIKIITTESQFNQVIITICDNGTGMDADIIKKIFTPFYTTKSTGSGIGLSFCRQIINMHGGTIDVNSVPGEGSQFIIKINNI
ncbi:PAS domain-containing sensor histidine kinase [Prevotella sp. 10(H)]|uniref:sensor histidine kinase n=1 Tax=Prevotella sp. 10(H) TaxID=1158294 RepID=UPI0018CBF3B1|nr:HAMP domain-containing sensor histidine kinase [Prevotella sp. 10(H)]